MAFRAEELSAKVFPTVLAIACPEDTLSKGKPTHGPCPGPSSRPCPEDTRPGGDRCPEDTQPPRPRPKKARAEGASGALILLRSQLRERLTAAEL